MIYLECFSSTDLLSSRLEVLLSTTRDKLFPGRLTALVELTISTGPVEKPAIIRMVRCHKGTRRTSRFSNPCRCIHDGVDQR